MPRSIWYVCQNTRLGKGKSGTTHLLHIPIVPGLQYTEDRCASGCVSFLSNASCATIFIQQLRSCQVSLGVNTLNTHDLVHKDDKMVIVCSPQQTNSNLEDASDKFSLHADIPFLQKSHHRIWYIWLVIAIVGRPQIAECPRMPAAFLRSFHSACRSLLASLPMYVL